jgi:YidC/Oxa1 family membrane protein insertase
MEKRAIIAALLIGALFVAAQMLGIFGPPAPGPEAPPPTAPTRDGAAPKAVPPAPTAASQPPAGPVEPRPRAPVPASRALVQTPLLRAGVSSDGGVLVEWELAYRGAKPMVLPGRVGPRGLVVERPGAESRPVPFRLSTQEVRLDRERPSGEIVLEGEDGFGLHVRQTLRFHADRYTVERAIRVENRHSVAQSAEVVLAWEAPESWGEGQAEDFQGQRPTRVVTLDERGLRREDLTAVQSAVREGRWVALESEWYLAAWVPTSAGFRLMEAKRPGPIQGNGEGKAAGAQGKAPAVIQTGLRASLPHLQPGQAWEGTVLMYVGPKEYDRLRSMGLGLEKSIYFGGFPIPEGWGGLPMEWVVVPVLWLMHWIYAHTGNYGLAIILLTVLTKVIFFPLSVKSMRSMKAMQALQPQINALRAKLKNDAQRLQRETMELYRQHRVNPLGGCLPMIVQIPIFYALYVALSVSVEIQNAPFLCIGRAPSWALWFGGRDVWICDLAAQDWTYVLPVLMGVSMFVQQKMTPVVGDPRQAKIMMLMPLFFTFMFLNLPSGLVLYWTLSNVLQIVQQYWMDRDAKAVTAPARAARKA